MRRGKLSLSIRIIPVAFIFLLGIFPLLLSQTVVSRTIRQIIQENTSRLTKGNLELSRHYLNYILGLVEIHASRMVESRYFLAMLGTTPLQPDSLHELLERSGLDRTCDDLLLVDVSEKRVLAGSFPDLNRFIESEQAALLLENSSRSLWMGRSPVGSANRSDKTMWLYKSLFHEGRDFIVALSVKRELFNDLLSQFSASAEADVLLISSDNQTIPEDRDFFQYPFSARALSRSLESRYNIFYDTLESETGREKLMVQAYTDPDYLYNLVVLTPEKILFSGFDAIVRISAITLLSLSALMLLAGLLLAYFVSRRLYEFLEAAEKIGAGHYDLGWKPVCIGIKEINRLSVAMEDLAGVVQEGRRVLESRVQERSEELQRTRQILIHSEKMALMGRQGAKVAHEINNPLGVAVTASSHLGAVLSDVEKKITAESLTKRDFQNFMETSRVVVETIDRNLRHAAGMIVGFKNFAADQAKEDREVISVDHYVGEILTSLSYELRKTPFRIEYDGDESLKIETIPSILYQTLTNLIHNSLLHGFEGLDRGVISIDIKKVDDHVVILYRDDGRGISEEDLSRLYKPFFTTKPGEGGTGLGLNIIKDLIETSLKGTILCQSKPGEGVLFTIRFPISMEGDNG